jgi:glutaminyl-tRNA synthetase
LELTNTVMSKRKLLKLVEDGIVDGWDDPRLPTICGLRRRGYTKDSILDFCERIGVAKKKSTVDYALLEHCVREDLKIKAPRIMAVTDPVKVVITNYPENQEEMVEIPNNPENPEMGTRQVVFTRELYIEREDYMENPPKKYFRMYPGNEVRLMGAYIVKCEKGVYDDAGNLIEIHCTYDPETKSNSGNSTRKVKGTLHWVSAAYGVPLEVRSYKPIFTTYEEDGEVKEVFNENSLTIQHGFAEPEITRTKLGDGKFQFVRRGYYCIDTKDSKEGHLVVNETVALKSSYKPPTA